MENSRGWLHARQRKNRTKKKEKIKKENIKNYANEECTVWSCVPSNFAVASFTTPLFCITALPRDTHTHTRFYSFCASLRSRSWVTDSVGNLWRGERSNFSLPLLFFLFSSLPPTPWSRINGSLLSINPFSRRARSSFIGVARFTAHSIVRWREGEGGSRDAHREAENRVLCVAQPLEGGR